MIRRNFSESVLGTVDFVSMVMDKTSYVLSAFSGEGRIMKTSLTGIEVKENGNYEVKIKSVIKNSDDYRTRTITLHIFEVAKSELDTVDQDARFELAEKLMIKCKELELQSA